MTGQTLHDLESVRDDVADKLTTAQAVAEQLKSGSSEEVVKALKVILASDDPVRQEFPQLEAFIDRAQPAHLHAPLLRAALMANIPVWLHGEAGSGKSTVAERSADWLGLPFRSISLGPSSSKADLMGYRDGHGEYRGTGFREVYEDGGVFLFDEIDNAHPSILTLLNAAIANGHGEFPDGRVARHETTRFVAAANTIGKGATAEYVGRAPIDAATIDRFAFIQMDTDPDLEQALVLGGDIDRQSLDIAAGGVPDRPEWLAEVRAHREAVEELGIRAIISTRAALYGARLSEQGVGLDWLREMLLYKGMRQEEREKLVKAAAKLRPKHVGGLAVDTKISSSGEVQRETAFQPPVLDVEYIQKLDPYSLASKLDDAMHRLNDAMKSLVDGIELKGELEKKSTKALLALSWRLEQEGKYILTGYDTEMVRRAMSKAVSVDLLEKWCRDYLHPVRLDWETNDDSSAICRMREQLDSAQLQGLLNDFRDEYQFTPGPYTMLNWLVKTGRLEDLLDA